jgi:enoyl-CoA hydratase/carnithine racemase
MPAWHEIDVTGPIEGLVYEKDPPLAIITLNRPEHGNAMHPAMFPSIRAIWEDIRTDRNIRAVIVTGAGDRHFSTGADLAIAAADAAVSNNVQLDQSVFWTARQNRVWKPVIAAVNGICAGGGLHHVVDADIVVAAENAQFLDTHVNVGMVGGLENIGLARRLPLGTALRMSLQGRDYRLTAQRAHELGLVDELAPAGEALAVARKIAASVAANSPQAVALTLQAIWGSLETGLEPALQHAWALIRMHWSHPDFLEGPRAFVEKRAPRWDPDPDAKIQRDA